MLVISPYGCKSQLLERGFLNPTSNINTWGSLKENTQNKRSVVRLDPQTYSFIGLIAFVCVAASPNDMLTWAHSHFTAKQQANVYTASRCSVKVQTTTSVRFVSKWNYSAAFRNFKPLYNSKTTGNEFIVLSLTKQLQTTTGGQYHIFQILVIVSYCLKGYNRLILISQWDTFTVRRVGKIVRHTAKRVGGAKKMHCTNSVWIPITSPRARWGMQQQYTEC